LQPARVDEDPRAIARSHDHAVVIIAALACAPESAAPDEQ
jgi:hypothetical protein